MDIQICQCCGIIIRGKSKFCTGCGTTISKFSPVTLPVISHTAAPLAVTLDPDPLVLERTMVKVRYASLPTAAPGFVPGGSDAGGNGGNGGNGHSGDGNGGNGGNGGHGQAAAASTSRLQNILGNAAARGAGGGPANVADMISYEEEQAPAQFDPAAGAAYANVAEATAEAMPIEFAPTQPAPAQPQGIAPKPSSTFTRIVTTAGAFDALAGSTAVQAAIPVTVTTALSPGLDAGSIIATNLSAAPSAVPITSAEPPQGAPSATSYTNATTVVAPSTGSPENVPAGQPSELLPEPPAQAAPPASPERQQPLSFESQASSPAHAEGAAPPAVADFFNNADAITAAANAHAAAQAAAAGAETAPLPQTDGDGPPPLLSPDQLTPTTSSPTPAAAPTGNGLVIAPPSVSPTPPTAAATPQAAQPAAPAFNPVANNSSSFDFFAQQSTPFPAVAADPPAPSLGGVVTADAPRADTPAPSILDSNKFSNGVPSVVQDAMRAAASASQTNLTPVGTVQDDDSKTRIVQDKDEFPDESSKRGKKNSDDDKSDADKASEKNHRSRFRADRGDDEEEKPKEPEKTLKIAGMELKTKTALTAGILVLFLGLPMCFFVLNILGKAVSSIAGGGGPVAYVGGDWSFGVLSDGRNIKGTVNFKQTGNTFTGMGVDNFGNFVIQNGSYNYPKVVFAKIYIDDQGRPKGKPIMYQGKMDWVNPEPGKGNMPFAAHMYGIWQFQKREGYGWRGTIVNKNGKWEAGQIRVDPPADGSGGGSGSGEGGGMGFDPGQWIRDLLGFPKDGSPAKMATFFCRIAGMLLLLGLGLVFASVKFFGPAGMLNIWAKKEYIPSQFKAQHYKMVRDFGKNLKTGGLPLGWRADWNVFNFWWPRKLALPPETRAQNPHVMLLGAGSKGKSRLVASMIHHDIESNDRAVVVIDSDGTLIDLLMAKIASSNKGADIAKRLIIIDPTHGGDVFAYNPLEYPDDGDLQNAASAVVFGFKAIYTEPPGSQSQWNQQTANILRNAAILLMANGKTLTDLPVLLSENDFRDVLLEKVERLKNEKAEYTTLLEAWAQYKRLARTDQWINWVEPILNRVQPMLGDPRIRPILTKTKGDLNLKEIISEGKILFVKIPQGQLDQNANLLGSLIVTGLKQAAMGLSLKGSSRKHQCALYLDEFDSFIEKETFDAITSETKKFQIGLIGSSKTLQGLPEDYRNQIIINCGTMCCFALAKKDGDILGPQMFRVDGRKIKHQTLQNIFNKVNTAPQFELISDEEKLNIDRVVGQEERHFFCYRVGTVAGVFQMRAPEFNDIPDKDINWTLIDQIYARSVPKD